MDKVIIYGNGAAAQVAHTYLVHDLSRNVAAFTVPERYVQSETLLDLPVVDLEKLVDLFPPSDYRMFIAIGPHRCNEVREKAYFDVKSRGYELINVICSGASIMPNLECGDNVLIDQSSVIQPFVTLGCNVNIIHSVIAHHTCVGSHVQIVSATLGGRVYIEDNVFIGMNAVIREDVKIGKGSIIGAGAIIMSDVAEYSVYTAPPPRKRKVDARRIELIRGT